MITPLKLVLTTSLASGFIVGQRKPGIVSGFQGNEI